MLYAREVIALLGAFPGRDFRMGQILRHVDHGLPLMDAKARSTRRKAVGRALEKLAEVGQVETTPARARGGSALYRWKK